MYNINRTHYVCKLALLTQSIHSLYHRGQSPLYGYRLALAIVMSIAIMSLAIAIGLWLTLYSGVLLLGFVPLFVGWVALHRYFLHLIIDA